MTITERVRTLRQQSLEAKETLSSERAALQDEIIARTEHQTL